MIQTEKGLYPTSIHVSVFYSAWFKLIDSAKWGLRVRSLTKETVNALFQIVTGTVEITEAMLRSGCSYVLPNKIQSNRSIGGCLVAGITYSSDKFVKPRHAKTETVQPIRDRSIIMS